MLQTLAFLTQEYVFKVFEIFIGTNYVSNNGNLMTRLIDNFDSNWIGQLQRRHCKKPTFSIEIWICFALVI